MTRLTKNMIEEIPNSFEKKNILLREKIGKGYFDLGKAILNSKIDLEKISKMSVAVVPVTTGLGEIGNFAESVKAIAEGLGFKSDITQTKDVEGLFEAKNLDADIAMMADDNRFLAINLKTGKVTENDYCTAAGYIKALELMAGKNKIDIKNEEILLIGYGRMGKVAYEMLREKGYNVAILEDETYRVNGIKEDIEYEHYSENEFIFDRKKIRNYKLILDCSNKGSWIKEEMLNEKTIVSAPGIPLSLDDKAAEKFDKNLVHDCLELGTAVMLVSCAAE
ncbi:MAG: 3-methylornithyl-N6-L-lysine dehydrogenase PylD [Anaerovoracaceae bacterium]